MLKESKTYDGQTDTGWTGRLPDAALPEAAAKQILDFAQCAGKLVEQLGDIPYPGHELRFAVGNLASSLQWLRNSIVDTPEVTTELDRTIQRMEYTWTEKPPGQARFG